MVLWHRAVWQEHLVSENWLSPWELARLKDLPSKRRRRDWLAARIAAKTLILKFLHQQKNLELNPTEIEIAQAQDGSPAVQVRGQTLPELSISIAHSHGHGLAGLSIIRQEGHIGVDLERLRPTHPRLAQRLLTATERQALRRRFLGQEKEALILYWTLKEAAQKALRLARPLSQLEVRITSDGQAHIIALGAKAPLRACYQRSAEFFIAWALSSAEHDDLLGRAL